MSINKDTSGPSKSQAEGGCCSLEIEEIPEEEAPDGEASADPPDGEANGLTDDDCYSASPENAASAVPLLDGPRLNPLSGRSAKGLVVLLHGYSLSGDDMIRLAERFRRSLPDLAFVAPHGPEVLPGGGRAWFPVARMELSEFWSGAVTARPVLDRFLDTERDRLGITEDRIVLVGFSQGTVLSLHVAFRRPSAVGAVVGYAGMLAGRNHLDEIEARPPVTLIHGDQDPFVSLETMEDAAAALKEAGVPVTTSVSPDVGHSIGGPGLRAGVEALQEVYSSQN